MDYIRESTDIWIEAPTVISLGKFDGLHMGHKLLLERMLKKKQQEGLKAVMFTFDIPPKAAVNKEAFKVLTTNDEKESVFAKSGIDYLIEYPFTEEVRTMEPEAFVRMLWEKLHVKCIVAGKDFRFGHNRRGDYHLLKELGPRYGFETIIVDKRQYEGRDISSTFIREEIQNAHMEKANLLLGYEFFLQGTVLHGRKLGRKLGIPTVNLIPPVDKLLPPFGVYVSQVLIDGALHGGITNVGRKPTIEGENPIGVETHIFDYSEDLYGQEIQVRFLTWLRPEKKFSSIEELRSEMTHNIEQGRQYLKTYSFKSL